MAMMDRLLPTTGIGSLPHDDIAEAIRFSKKFDIPFLPELTKLQDSLSVKSIEDFICFKEFIKSTHELPLIKTQSFSTQSIEPIQNQIHFYDSPLKNFAKLPTTNPLALHCCNHLEIQELKDIKLSHLSFDASLIHFPREFFEGLLELNAIPVVGLVSTHGQSLKKCENFNQWKKVIREYPTKCWISPACGLSKFSIEESHNALDLLQEIQREILISLA